MRSFLILMIFSLLFLQACKKDSGISTDLNVSGFAATAFASGDAISIFGTGFDSNPANDIVSFNGVKGEVATASPNRLQVIVPLLAAPGKITVTVNGKSATSTQTYTIVNVLQGTYASSFILTADKKYLLRGNVVFNSKLIIQAGTVIYGEKLTHGSLTADDIDFEGTVDQPIIFTSDQAPGSRYPGDWTGLSIGAALDGNTGQIVTNGVFQYVRIEYAGYHTPGTQGTALNLVAGPNGTYQYIQTSYSAGAGITLSGDLNNQDGGFVHHIIAFGCQGDDFRLTGNNITAQYGLGLKDPYYADVLGSNGITSAVQLSRSTNNLSNFTLVGYNPDARNILNVGTTIANNAGSGVLVGNYYISAGFQTSTTDPLVIYNSVIAGSWQAGVNIFGGSYNPDWNDYEVTTAPYPVIIRNNFVTGTSPAVLPELGGAFGREITTSGGFVNILTDPNRTLFASLNDTTKALSFSAGKDDLGIKTLTDYSHLNNPGVLPAAGSPLLTSASFPLGSYADNPFFNKDITYVGAFGTQDWTKTWSNFNPQITQY